MDELKKPGRPEVLTEEDKDNIYVACDEDLDATFENIAVRTGLVDRVSLRTVAQETRNQGFNTYNSQKEEEINHTQGLKRLEWCNERKDWKNEWKNKVVYTDEVNINNDGSDGKKRRVRRQRGQPALGNDIRNEPRMRDTQNHQTRITVGFYAEITYGHHSPLIAIQRRNLKTEREGPTDRGGFNTTQYITEILPPHVVPFLQKVALERDPAASNISNFLLLVDNRPAHKSSRSQATCKELGIAQLRLPSNSPDFNPIENVWAMLKDRLKKQWLKVRSHLCLPQETASFSLPTLKY